MKISNFNLSNLRFPECDFRNFMKQENARKHSVINYTVHVINKLNRKHSYSENTYRTTEEISQSVTQLFNCVLINISFFLQQSDTVWLSTFTNHAKVNIIAKVNYQFVRLLPIFLYMFEIGCLIFYSNMSMILSSTNSCKTDNWYDNKPRWPVSFLNKALKSLYWPLNQLSHFLCGQVLVVGLYIYWNQNKNTASMF